MRPDAALFMIHAMFSDHGLKALGWKFRWSGAKKQFGSCNYLRKTIKLSRPLTLLNSPKEVNDCILHEIAHALCFEKHGPLRNHHGPKWRAIATKIGCNGNRLYDNQIVVSPKGKYKLTCPNCQNVIYKHRRTKRLSISACTNCCRTFNGGKWDPKYMFVWSMTEEVE